MKSFWNRTQFFLIPSIIAWLLVLYIMVTTEKVALHSMINQWHCPTADFFFTYYTNVGASVPFIIAGALLFYKYSVAFFVLVSQLITTILTYPVKGILDVDRPRAAFEKLHLSLYQVDGVHLYGSHSFPSGHTSSAFALFLALCLYVKKPVWQVLFFVLAVLVGYSRIYLSQHFIQDVFGGAIIGVISVIITYFAYHRRVENNPNFDKSLRDLIGNKK
jgi:membrane-associated phospholipid phosphatase